MLDNTITVNGKTYDETDVFKRKLLVKGIVPTDYEQYQYINVLVDHRLSKDDAKGMAQTTYRYHELNDLPKFFEHELPYFLEVTMTTETKKDGDKIEVILAANFASIQEIEMTLRKPPRVNSQQTKLDSK